MGKYSNLQTDIFSVFASGTWTAENIQTFPQNFVINNNSNEFVRVSIVPGSPGANRVSVKGILIIDIFVPSGVGPTRLGQIADKLDLFLENKSVSSVSGKVVQFGNSTLSLGQFYRDNAGLYRSDYTIPFNFFGVL